MDEGLICFRPNVPKYPLWDATPGNTVLQVSYQNLQVAGTLGEFPMEPTAPKSQFEGLSQSDLKQAMLNRLGEKSNLQSESRHLRDRLSTLRSALAAINHEIQQIQYYLSVPKLIGFPKQSAPKEPELKRVHGRWGKTSFEPVPQTKTEPKVQPVSGSVRQLRRCYAKSIVSAPNLRAVAPMKVQVG